MDTPVTPTPAEQPQKKGNTAFRLLVIVCLLSLIMTAFCLYHLYLASNTAVKTNTTSPVVKKSEIRVPKDAIRISGCIPHEGEHWVRVEDLPTGPFYVTNKEKVMAVEFMFKEQDIPGKDAAHMSFPDTVAYMEKNNLTLSDLVHQIEKPIKVPDITVKAMTIHWTAPHGGLVEPHYDMHMYLVDPKELNNVCPDSGLQDALPDAVFKELKERGVPIPGADTPATNSAPVASPTAMLHQ